MTKLTEKQLAQCAAATAAARKVLKRGDMICAHGCAGTKKWFIFGGFDRDWIYSRSGYVDDCHAASIYKVNGKPVNFGDVDPIENSGSAAQ